MDQDATGPRRCSKAPLCLVFVLLALLPARPVRADPGSIFSGPASADVLASYWNPAAMTLMSGGTHLGLHSTVMYARVHHVRTTINPYDGQPYPEASLEVFKPDPALGAVFNAGLDDWRFGLSLTMPSMDGAAWTETQGGKPASTRHYATSGMIIQASIQPSAAYRINRYISVGLGLDILFLAMESHVVVDFGAKINSYANKYCTANCRLDPLLSWEDPAFEAMTDVSGSTWGVGGFAGILVTPLPWLRIGAIFRTGGGELDIPVDIQVNMPGNIESFIKSANLDLILPEVRAQGEMSMVVPMSLAGAVTLGPFYRFLFTADVRWVNRSKTGLNMVSITEATSKLVTDQALILIHDDYVMVGARVEVSAASTLKLAARFEYSPKTVPDAYLTPISMDFDSYSVHAGLAWQATAWLGLMVEYTHYFLPKRTITSSNFGPNPKPLTKIEAGFNLPSPTGSYWVDSDRFGLGLVFSF